MLGRGCPYKNQCVKYQKETDWWRQHYCESTMGGYERCAENPSNYSNREQLRQENAQFNEKTAKDDRRALLVIAAVIVFIVCKAKGIF